MRLRIFLLAAVTTALVAQQPSDPLDRVARASKILAGRAKRLPDYVCVQTVDRRYYKHRRISSPPSCDQLRAAGPHDMVLESTDRLRLDVKVSRGNEIGSWPGSQFSSRSIFELIGGGAYETGMLGALISDIFGNPGATYRHTRDEGGLSAYSYRIPEPASHYQIKAGSKWTTTSFSGTFSLDSNSADLTRLTAQADEMAPETGICETQTAVDYQRVTVGAGEFLVPQESSMRHVMRDGTEVRITAVYSGWREYRGESTIRFDEAPVADGAKDPEVAGPLPEGLPVSLALTEPIDTDTAAAGDIVRARIRKAVRDPHSKTVLAPAGAVVEGRIVQMEHWMNEPRRFTISILLEKLQVGGLSRPLYANLDRRGPLKPGDVLHGTAVFVEPTKGVPLPGVAPRVAAFPFMTENNRYLVRAGYESEWVTVPPPADENK
jgi:hypothetical protein